MKCTGRWILLLALTPAPVAAQSVPEWRLSTSPTLSIRNMDLFNVGDVTVLSNGNIVLTNRGSREIMWFRSDGLLLSRIGGEGEGPGEFRSITSLQTWRNDTLYVFDAAQQRLTSFSSNGALVAVHRVTHPARELGMVGRLTDGSWYGRTKDRVLRSRSGSLIRDTIQFFLLDSNLELQRVVAEVPGAISASFDTGNGPGFRHAPFTPEVLERAHKNRLLMLRTDSPILRVLTAEDLLQETISLPGARGEVEQKHFAKWIEDALQRVPDAAKPRARAILKGVPHPDSLPIYESFLVDTQGNLWLQLRSRGDRNSWVVTSLSGTLIARLSVPANYQIRHVGRNDVGGIWSDPLGVEEIRFHRLLKQ